MTDSRFVSQRSTASTSVLFWYLFATSVIVVFIKLIYSLSDRKDVFNFQKPGPLGLVLFARWRVIKEWSVLYPGKISAFVQLPNLDYSGLLLLQVNLLISGLEFIMF